MPDCGAWCIEVETGELLGGNWGCGILRSIQLVGVVALRVDRRRRLAQNSILLQSGEDSVEGIEVGCAAGYHDMSVEALQYSEWVGQG